MINNLTLDAIKLYDKGREILEGPELTEIIDLYSLQKYISVGFAIDLYDSQVKQIKTIKKYKERFRDNSLNAGVCGELHTLGLISRLGQVKISPINESRKHKTPDFNAEINGVELEIESTAASPKELQKERYVIARSLNSILTPVKNHGCDWIIYLGENYNSDQHSAVIKEFLTTANVGDHIDSQNEYFATIINPSLNDGVLISNVSEYSKPTWLHDHPEKFNQFTAEVKIIKGKSTGQIRIGLQTDLKGYFNPILNKLDDFQGTSLMPFIICLNINALPNALRFYNEKVNKILQEDERLSGLLVYYYGLEGDNYLYRFKYFLNKNSKFSNCDLIFRNLIPGAEYTISVKVLNFPQQGGAPEAASNNNQ